MEQSVFNRQLLLAALSAITLGFSSCASSSTSGSSYVEPGAPKVYAQSLEGPIKVFNGTLAVAGMVAITPFVLMSGGGMLIN